MTIKMTLLAAGAALILPLAALAAPQGGAEGFHRGGAHFDFLKGVTLTDDQQTQIHALTKAARESARPSMHELRALHKEISDKLAQAGTVNESELAALQQKAEAIRAQLDTLRLHTAIQVRALLTSAQLAQSAQVHAQLTALHQQTQHVLGEDRAAPAAAPAAQ